MKNLGILLSVAAAFVAQPALAVVVTSGSGTIDATDAMQTNRINRTGVASTWASSKAFPGTLAQSPTYYDLLNATFASNALQTIYYEVTYTSGTTTNPQPFSAAYLDSFDPTNIATNYLGDAGSSPVGNTVSYQIVVGQGHQFLLNFQNVAGVPANYTYSVSAFSDANRGENFLPVTGTVPEPATWAMMLIGFGGLGHAMRRRAAKCVRIRFA